MRSRILLVDDEPCFFDAVKTALSETTVDVVWEDSGAKAIQRLKQNPHGFAMAVLDYKLKDITGPDVAHALRKINPKLQIVFASGFKDEAFLLDQLKFGSSGFYLKGEWPTSQLKDRILACVERYQNEFRLVGLDDYEVSKAEAELALAGFAGRDEKSYALLKEIERARGSSFSALIVGETGSGKEHVAKAMTPMYPFVRRWL